MNALDAMVALPFHDREEAAHALAAALKRYVGTHPLVLAIPRGGVPIGRIVADALGGELDVILVRKLGAPGNPEFAIGAIDEYGTVTQNEQFAYAGTDAAYVQLEAARQLAVIRERRARYKPQHTPQALTGRTVIITDDGLATGATMISALNAAKMQKPARLICAVPVAARESLTIAARYADETVCLATPEPFRAVGHFYRNFSGVSEEEAIALLSRPSCKTTATPAPALPQSRLVKVRSGSAMLEGELILPASARGQVLFAHGSGSSRHSPRNRFVATALHRFGFATLLFDLLTPAEDRDTQARFDIALLTMRLAAALEWAQQDFDLQHLPLGIFGASTGAAAALRVAAAYPEIVHAVVSRGGRPDMAGAAILTTVHSPTLLIVGGEDHHVIELNRSAQALMPVSAKLAVIPRATHLFEEPGTLEEVARLAGDWFEKWLPR